MSSRLVYAPSGRPLYVEVTSHAPELEHGLRFAVLGTEFSMTSDRIQFTGEPTGRSPLPDETATTRKRAGSHNGVEHDHRPWTDDDREQARRLQMERLSQAKIAERVCGDRKFRSTVQMWLRQATVTRH